MSIVRHGKYAASFYVGWLTFRVSQHPSSNPLAKWRWAVYIDAGTRPLMIRVDW